MLSQGTRAWLFTRMVFGVGLFNLLTACGTAAPHTLNLGDGCSTTEECPLSSCCACTDCDEPGFHSSSCQMLVNGQCPLSG